MVFLFCFLFNRRPVGVTDSEMSPTLFRKWLLLRTVPEGSIPPMTRSSSSRLDQTAPFSAFPLSSSLVRMSQWEWLDKDVRSVHCICLDGFPPTVCQAEVAKAAPSTCALVFARGISSCNTRQAFSTRFLRMTALNCESKQRLLRSIATRRHHGLYQNENNS